MSKMLIVIDNEVVEVTNTHDYGYGITIECDNGCEYIVFDSHESAGEAAREYWEDMAQNDKAEFTCLVGEETLISWCLGEYAGPGTTQVSSLEEWLDLWLDIPEEQWASYDGDEIEGASFNKHFEDETGFEDRQNIVLYKSN